MENIRNIEDCKLECEKAGPDICLSVELLNSADQCIFNNVDTSTRSVSSCFNSYLFSEPSKLILFVNFDFTFGSLVKLIDFYYVFFFYF